MNFHKLKKIHIDSSGYGRLNERMGVGSQQVSDAAWDRGFNFTGASSINRWYGDSIIKGFEDRVMAGNSLSDDETNLLLQYDSENEFTEFEILDQSKASEILSKQGLSEHLKLDGPISNVGLKRMIDRKKQNMYNNYVLDSAKGARWWKGMGIEMAAAIVDPLNIPLMFTAAFTRPAFLMNRLKDSSRLNANLSTALYTGVAASAVLEAPIYGQASQEQLDYTAINSVVNIAFGGTFSMAFGGLGHAMGADIRAVLNNVGPKDKAGIIKNTPYRGSSGAYSPINGYNPSVAQLGQYQEVMAKLKTASKQIDDGEPVDLQKIEDIKSLEKELVSQQDLEAENIAFDRIQETKLKIQRLKQGQDKINETIESGETMSPSVFKKVKQNENNIAALEKELKTLEENSNPVYQRLFKKLYEHEDIVETNRPGFIKDGIRLTKDDPSLDAETKKIIEEKDAIGQEKITKSADELIEFLEALRKDGKDISDFMELFDPSGKYFDVQGFKAIDGNSEFKSQKMEKAKKIHSMLANIFNDEPSPIDRSKIDDASQEYANLDQADEGPQVEELEIAEEVLDEKALEQLKLDLAEVDSAYKATFGNTEVHAILKRLFKCKDIT